ncbi:MAG: M56 family metallopeptidase, partial [Bacteroidota bacterium]
MTFYLLQVSVCWLVFYGLYWLILSRETFFRLNRWYLLGTLISGLLIPLLEIPLWNAEPQDDLLIAYLGEVSVTAQNFGITLEEVVITAGEHAPAWSSASILLGIYLMGVLMFASLFLGGLWRIYQLRQRSEVEVFEGYHLLYTSEIHLPFSFFNQLFWSQSDHWTAEERSAILRHELAHIKGRHSWDVLLLELLKVFFWFSPGIYLYKRSLRNVHEYLADSAVLQNTRKKQYGRLLLRQVQQQTQPALVNPFFHSQIKKRIQMMIRNKSKRFALYKYAFLLPLTALLLLTFSSNVKGASELVDRGFIAEALTVVISDFDKEKAKAKIREALRNYDSSASDDGKKKAHRTISDAYFALLKAHPEHREEIRQLAKEEINSMELPLFIDVVDGEDRLVMFEGKLPAGLREREAKEAEVFSVVDKIEHLFVGTISQ